MSRSSATAVSSSPNSLRAHSSRVARRRSRRPAGRSSRGSPPAACIRPPTSRSARRPGSRRPRRRSTVKVAASAGDANSMTIVSSATRGADKGESPRREPAGGHESVWQVASGASLRRVRSTRASAVQRRITGWSTRHPNCQRPPDLLFGLSPHHGIVARSGVPYQRVSRIRAGMKPKPNEPPVTDILARRAERKREEIVRAGLKVFAEKGFCGRDHGRHRARARGDQGPPLLPLQDQGGPAARDPRPERADGRLRDHPGRARRDEPLEPRSRCSASASRRSSRPIASSPASCTCTRCSRAAKRRSSTSRCSRRCTAGRASCSSSSRRAAAFAPSSTRSRSRTWSRACCSPTSRNASCSAPSTTPVPPTSPRPSKFCSGASSLGRDGPRRR